MFHVDVAFTYRYFIIYLGKEAVLVIDVIKIETGIEETETKNGLQRVKNPPLDHLLGRRPQCY